MDFAQAGVGDPVTTAVLPWSMETPKRVLIHRGISIKSYQRVAIGTAHQINKSRNVSCIVDRNLDLKLSWCHSSLQFADEGEKIIAHCVDVSDPNAQRRINHLRDRAETGEDGGVLLFVVFVDADRHEVETVRANLAAPERMRATVSGDQAVVTARGIGFMTVKKMSCWHSLAATTVGNRPEELLIVSAALMAETE